MHDQVIYKICPALAWAEAAATGVYTGSADDDRDGYIHFSTAAQVAGTLDKHFPGRADLLLLAVPVAALAGDLKFEPSRGGALFPHLYAPLPASAVLWHEKLPLSAEGHHIVPDLTQPDAAT
jgi:uncharacterized protein (DUF952 family)